MQLLRLPESERARVRFVPHPSVGLLRTDSPADEIWRAVLEQDDGALAAIDPGAGPAWLVVERRDAEVSVSRLGEPAWRFTIALCAGQPLYEALDASSGVEADTLLAKHLAARRFIAFTLEDEKVKTEPSP